MEGYLITQELFSLLEEKHPVVVLKDVSIKYLLLILEFVYLGTVEIETEDVNGFEEVARIMQIAVEFENIRQEEEMSQDLLTEIEDEEMDSSSSEIAMKPLTYEEFSAGTTRKIDSGRKFENDEDSHKKGPPAKKIKKSPAPLSLIRKVLSADTEAKPCIYCDKKMKEKDRRYHQKFCWENPSRITSDCKHCDRKFQVPGKLRVHTNLQHPEFKY
jgi:hypothetical protein